MKRKKVRQKAHAPGPRTPRYPVAKGPTGRLRRLLKQNPKRQPPVRRPLKGDAKAPNAVPSVLLATAFQQDGKQPSWIEWVDNTIYGVGAYRNASVGDLRTGDDIVIVELAKSQGKEYSYRTHVYEEITFVHYAVMPLSYAYWRLQVIHAALYDSDEWDELRRMGSYGYAAVLPEISAIVVAHLGQAEKLRDHMLEQIAALR